MVMSWRLRIQPIRSSAIVNVLLIIILIKDLFKLFLQNKIFLIYKKK
jgi:hypothetical protein